MEQPSDPLSSAVEKLRALEAEHAPILRQIRADPGMSAATRELLVRHLEEEESEAKRRVSAARGETERAPGAPVPPGRQSVGSLCPAPRGAAAGSGRSVGSLRRS